MHTRVAHLVAVLDLMPHPEGGYFKEVHRSAQLVDPRDRRATRSALTAIYFLLTADDVSRWHRVSSDETWHFHEGAPLALLVTDPDFADVTTHILGPWDGKTEPVRVVPASQWQAARSTGDYTLVSCVVGPGFDFADFEMLRDAPVDAERLKRSHPSVAMLI